MPDLILDIILIKTCIYKLDKDKVNGFNKYINMINFFYSLVVDSLSNVLTPIRFNKVRKGLEESVISEKIYIPQWFEDISMDYANMNKKKREKELMHVMDAIYNYYLYEAYLECKISVEKYCEEHGCCLGDVHNADKTYPDEIVW